MTRYTNQILLFACLAGLLLLGGCLTGGETDTVQDANPGDTPQNGAPTISGSPKSSTKVGEPYSFTPNASDPDGDSLSFSIENRPRWAAFDTSDGTLSGTPNMGDEGTYSNILIKVSDGTDEDLLPQFTVNVTQTGTGSATLSWSAPTQNEDGTALTDLAGYKVYYGVSQGNYPNEIDVGGVGITTLVVDNLSPDTYYFVATAYNGSGVESGFSNVATKTVN